MKLLLSIVTVVYNAELSMRGLLENIKKAKNQANIEFIVVDGGSTDGTIKLIQEFDSVIDCVISEPDDGIYDAMNKGMNIANGDFCLFLGADDELVLDNISDVLYRLNKRHCIHYGNVIYKGRSLGAKTNKFRILRHNIPHQAVFYPKEVFKCRFYELKYKICSDHEYNIRLMHEGWCFEYFNIAVSKFGEMGISSLAADKEFANDYFKIIKKNAGVHVSLFIWLGKKAKLVVSRYMKAVKNTRR